MAFSILLPGPMFPILFAAALPPAIVAVASGGRAQQNQLFDLDRVGEPGSALAL